MEGKRESFNNNRSAEKLFLSQKGKRFQYCKIDTDLFQTIAKMLLLAMARVGQNVGYNFECCCLKTAVILVQSAVEYSTLRSRELIYSLSSVGFRKIVSLFFGLGVPCSK